VASQSAIATFDKITAARAVNAPGWRPILEAVTAACGFTQAAAQEPSVAIQMAALIQVLEFNAPFSDTELNALATMTAKIRHLQGEFEVEMLSTPSREVLDKVRSRLNSVGDVDTARFWERELSHTIQKVQEARTSQALSMIGNAGNRGDRQLRTPSPPLREPVLSPNTEIRKLLTTLTKSVKKRRRSDSSCSDSSDDGGRERRRRRREGLNHMRTSPKTVNASSL
jgi:hypothetical protein